MVRELCVTIEPDNVEFRTEAIIELSSSPNCLAGKRDVCERDGGTGPIFPRGTKLYEVGSVSVHLA